MKPAKKHPDPERLLRGVEWTVLRRLDGLLQGNYRTFFQGMGLDFADLRPYLYADDVRTIDWNVTARLNEPHVRRFHEDRELQAWFLIDTSPSLDFGSQGRTKLDLSQELVAVLASLLVRGGNKVGACLYDGTLPRLLPVSGGRNAVLNLLRALAQPCPPTTAETDLSVLLETMEGVLRRRSLVFVISDYYSTAGWEKLLGNLSRRHEVLTVHLSDPSENTLPDMGVLWLEDAESGQQMLVDTTDPGFRKRLNQAHQARKATLARQFRDAQVDPLTLSTDDDLVRSLLGWSQRRRYRKTLAGGTR